MRPNEMGVSVLESHYLSNKNLGSFPNIEKNYIGSDGGRKQIGKPFIKWAGGKRWFTKYIDLYLPERVKNGEVTNYIEPFVGGGAVFFYMIQNYSFDSFIINDSCVELVGTYMAVRDDVDFLLENLSRIEDEYINSDANNYKKFYYKKRSEFNTMKKWKTEKAALFIFLNKASFNGIFRTNSKGEYNVPVGYYKDFKKIDKDNIKIVSNILQKVTILNKDFRELKKYIKKDSFIYADPPYTVAHENNGFIEYNKKIFSWEDQMALKQFAKDIRKKGSMVMISNAKHENISNLYSDDFYTYTLSRSSLIGGKGSVRKRINEYLFLSYKIKSVEEEHV